MKRCTGCDGEFENQFRFCPVDGTLLIRDAASYTYRPTLISNQPLAQRLLIEARFLVDRFHRSWPCFKADPLAFTKTQFIELGNNLKKAAARPYVLTSSLIAATLVLSLIVSVLLLERHSKNPWAISDSDDVALTITIDFQNAPKDDSKSGVGAGENGRVGFQNGGGEGSRPVPARVHGGGSGGTRDQSPPSQGRPPQPSVIPAPIPTTSARLPPRALPTAGIDIDPALWKDLPFPTYGDPRSKSKAPSNGPGDGGGVGTNNGTGIGEGDGPGFGPGRKGNMGGGEKDIGSGGGGGSGCGTNVDCSGTDQIYRVQQVNERAQVLSKPEPQYTEEARKRDVTGTVILRAVFSSSGVVTNIQAVQSLPSGLTEKAIAAARQIRFVPARRHGQAVSVYMQLEYNFNLY